MALSMLEHQSMAAFIFNSLNPCVSGFSLKWSHCFVLITISQMSRGRRREAGQETWILILVPGAPLNPFALVSWGCWNTAPHTGWLEATEIHSLMVLEVEVPNQRCQQCWSLLEAQRSALCLSLSSASIRGIACFGEVSLHLRLSRQMAFSLCVCVCVSCPLLMRTPVISD